VAWSAFVFLATSGKLADFFAVMLSLTVSTTSVSYFFIFPALVRLRRMYPETPRPYRVPGGMAGAWVVAILTEAFVVITAITLLWPGAINAIFGQGYSVEASWGVSRAFFEWATLGGSWSCSGSRSGLSVRSTSAGGCSLPPRPPKPGRADGAPTPVKPGQFRHRRRI
jgi:amino acid transporter